ncbi:MAG: PEP-CTERM sorting domain-containing protein [Candidatus Korobacteraceae bacterium]
MKLRIASLSLLALTLVTIPAMAQTVYSNGAINGNTDAWTINFGFIVSDTFNVTNNNTTVTGGSFGMWLFSGDTLSSAEVSITSGENSGTSYFDQTLNFTQGACTVNQYGYNVCQENTTFNGPTLNAGSYWLNLQNTSIPNGDPAYWDENSGPSKASENSVGSIPSEAFTVLGSSTTTSSTTSSTTTSVPEPSSIMLFGSGILGLASLVRRKLF